MAARVVLLVTSPRLPAGLLTAAAWDLVRRHPVLTAAETPQAAAVRAAGAAVTLAAGPPADALLAAAGTQGTAVWLAGPTGDEDVARALGHRLAREPGRAELELVYGSWDPPGARLLDAVTVMDRLLSPGGDPWKRQQTHRTLAQFLLEECYEAYDAIEAGDLGALREELGDILLQVVLHARIAQDRPEESRWTVDDVAGDLVAKLIRRNPHVFAGTAVADVDEIVENWEQIKRAEKSRASAMDGIALAQPALSLAGKVLQRARRAGVEVPVPPAPAGVDVADAEALGRALLGLVAAAREVGVDAEAALRRAALRQAAAVRAAETAP
ncbi:MazG family protein [Rhizomonospora bruguierae]|uniref:MazG family protein n=1 Tax=Rhizomonospora bruguierae TaxID=1581705 RepID=UPI001BCCC963|nr:MazG family protein [Micromonospora sp. NBRC 107566]